MKVPSLKKFKADELSLLYVDAVKKWANAPREAHHSGLAVAIADEFDRRGKPVPTDEVKAEMEMLLSAALAAVERLKARFGK